MSEAIRASKADSYKQMMMDANMTVFEDCVGACERIFKSPIPQSYTRHTSRFMVSCKSRRGCETNSRVE
jgi:predicted membrane chloride channel (bestrophin family)